MNPLRVAIICDFLEEGWPSMDLVAEMLLEQLQRDHSAVIAATRIRPSLRRRFTSGSDQSGKRFNADRFVNRFWDYPRFLRRLWSEFDLFHVIDHSYGQLLHELPCGRTVITCHDTDTFRCLLDPQGEPRSVFFRKMMKRTLSGFRRAARVTCDSAATRSELLAHNLVPPERAVVVHNGVHPSCSPAENAAADARAAQLIGAPANGQLELLHVGSTIERKRIEILLSVFAGVRKTFPHARLLRVGGDLTRLQTELAQKLNVLDSMVFLPALDRDALAAVYRRATLMLLPSEREGFGLPVVEAMASGTPVVASDLAVLREVGEDATIYCPVGDVSAWSQTVNQMLNLRCTDALEWDKLKSAGIKQAAKFTWAAYASKMVSLYGSLSASGGSH
jgi:glycosyltransferase involved in cell wall biosynthesis